MNKSPGSAARAGWKEKAGAYFQRYGIAIIFLLMVLIMSVLTGGTFLKLSNLLVMVRQIADVTIVAMGVTMVIITTGIDLGSGSVIALVSVVVASLAHPGQFPLIVPIMAGLAVGALTGLVNGLIIARVKIPPFIATLGMMMVARGGALIYSDGRPISNLSGTFEHIGGGFLMGISIPVWLMFAMVLLTHVILSHTRFGKHVYAIGGNQQAALVSGINVAGRLVTVYVFAGLMTGLAGIVLTSRLCVGQPTAGVFYELDAIAAAVIGGTSLSGGVGTAFGTLIGAMIIGILNNGLVILGVDPYWQQVVKGTIIVGAVVLDKKRHQ